MRASLSAATATESGGTQADPQLAETADLFEPLARHQGTAELARIASAAPAAALLLARCRLAPPPLVIAAATLYLSSFPVHRDAYRLAIVTKSPRLWWLAISQWSPALGSERLAVPVAVWLRLVGAAALLLAGALRYRRGSQRSPRRRPASSMAVVLNLPGEVAMSCNKNVRLLLPLFFSAALLSCGGGGGDSSTPEAAAPAPTPAPPPPPPPPAPSPPAPIPPMAQPPLDISGTAAPVGTDFWGDNSTANGGKGDPIDGLACFPSLDQTFHIHA
ncbi:MAG TPA: hypothetical protein VFK10_19925, partial [Burkholderiaceae bacterium]|nr:hypothetical protein [Burkholderiaceae bacterium]